MKSFLFALVIFLNPYLSWANDTATDLQGMPGGMYKLDKTHASLTWKVSHLGLSDYTARFTKFDAEINLNPTNLQTSKVSASIDPTSIKTDFPYTDKKDFDAQLVNDTQWFNATQFPKIIFRSNKIDITGNDTATMTGTLDFLGTKKPLSLDVTFNKALGNHPFKNKPAIGFSAIGSLKRSDFGMNTYIPQIGDNVDLIIEAEFIYAE